MDPMDSTSSITSYYKLLVNGMVYLVDPASSIAYTYDLVAPAPIGTVHWLDPSSEPTITLNKSDAPPPA